jgi:hypothetical protein
MRNIYTDLLLHTRQIDDEKKYGDKYIGESLAFTLNSECVYAFGQLATVPLDRRLYREYFSELRSKGFRKFLYESEGAPRPDLGGEQLGYMKSGEFFPIHNLWVKEV